MDSQTTTGKRVPAPTVDDDLARLEADLAKLGSACVAFSGGVDSSVVLAVAVRRLGAQRVVACTATSETYLARELEAATRLAEDLGVEHVVIETNELSDAAFTGNSRERCYVCKSHLVAQMRRVADDHGCAALVDGANTDDLGDIRPGLRAAAEGGVVHPLITAKLGKAAVRRLARALGLATWDAPQQACLASRIPYGDQITTEKLHVIAAAEDVLRGLGFRQCRVRHHGAIARVEVEVADIERAAGVAREEIARRLGDLGFVYVALDLRGFRSGSLNEV